MVNTIATTYGGCEIDHKSFDTSVNVVVKM